MEKVWKFSDEHRKKLSLSKLGKPSLKKGRPMSEESKLKMSISQKKRFSKGKEHHPRWIADRNLQRYNDDSRDRRSSMYREWRNSVWERDNYKCRIDDENCCGRIESHHILGWTSNRESRYQVNNGITLCHAHHPRKRAEEKRLIPTFQELVSVSKETI